MFEASVTKFVHAVGPDIYVPVPSLASSKECQLLQVVVKKKNKWFFLRDKYVPTDFKLGDIISDNDGVKVQPDDATDLVTYDKTSVIKITGQFAASFKATFEAELDGVDSITLDAKFGLIKRQEISQTALLSATTNRCVNMNHELLREVSQKKRRTLCVIVGVAQTAQPSSLHATLNMDLKSSAKILSSKVINTDEIESNNERVLDIPVGTILAYEVIELRIGKAGKLRLIVSKDAAGGFAATDQVDRGKAVGKASGDAAAEAAVNSSPEVAGNSAAEAAGTAAEDDTTALQNEANDVSKGILCLAHNKRRELFASIQRLCCERNSLRLLSTGLKEMMSGEDTNSQVAQASLSAAVTAVLLLLAGASNKVLQSTVSLIRSLDKLDDDSLEAVAHLHLDFEGTAIVGATPV